MVPNVNQITSKLATLDDQQLQQYAQMHQDDAYVLALAVSEKNRRAALRNSAQAQGGPQPTVVDQEVAEMAPAGISTLEAPAIDELGMAGGGVVGYQEGGTTMYDIPGLVLGDERIRGLVRGRDETEAEEELPWLRAFGRALLSGKTVDQVRAEQNAGLPAVMPAAAAAAPAAIDAAQNRTALNQADAGLRALPAAAAQPPAAPRPTPDQPALETAGIGAGRVPAAPVAQTPAAGGLADLRTMLTEAGAKRDAALKQQSDDLAAFYAASEQDIKDEQEELKARSKDQDKPFDEKRERISERQKELDAQRKQARSMALITAGLGMMAGESPNAFVNIARGAQAGLSQFAVDTQRIDKAREDLREELGKIADLQMQMRSATGEKLSQLRKEERKLRREGAFKVKEILTAAGAKDADAMYQRVTNGLVDLTIKNVTAGSDFERDMQKLAYQRGTALEQARISAGGRSNTAESKRATAYSNAVKNAQEAAQKDMRWMAAKDNTARMALVREYLDASLQLDPYLGEGAFVTAPATGAQIRRSSAMAQ